MKMTAKTSNAIRTQLLLEAAWEITRNHLNKFHSLLKHEKACVQEIVFEEFHSNCSRCAEDSDKYSCESSSNSGISSSIKTMTSSHPKILFSQHDHSIAAVSPKPRRDATREEGLTYLKSYSFLIKKSIPVGKVRSEKKINRTIQDKCTRLPIEKRNTWHIQLKK